LVAGWHIAKAFHSIEGIITALATAAIALKPAEHVIRESMPEELVIEPGHPSATLICIMKDTFTVGEAVRFQKRKTAIWFYGWVKFDDAFGREHQLDFRFCYRRGYGRFRLDHYREWVKEAES